tara:strand:- start:478 stop:627 length:150 start_codon:yes stop_codon:yes gene_type:complete
MEQKTHWIKYLSPLMGILFCPVTILFLWSIWPGSPALESEIELVEDLKP